MTTISSTQKLVPLIEDLSHSISEIASILKADQQEETPAAESAKEGRQKKEKKLAPEQQSSQETKPEEASSGTDSSKETDYTKEQVKAFLLTKNLEQVKGLYKELGVKKLSDIPVEKYADVMKTAAGFKDKEETA